MVGSLKIYGFWQDHHGKEVLLDNYRHRIEVTLIPRAYHGPGIIVSAVPVNKDSKFYLEMKRRLHDDWVTDVLGSDVELATNILAQLSCTLHTST